MPLVRITLREGHSTEERRAISDGVYEAMLETIKMPEHDRFHVILEQSSDNLIADETYLKIPRTGNTVFVEITLLRGRTIETKGHSTDGLRSDSPPILAYPRKTYSSF